MKLTAAITRQSEATLLALFVVGIIGPSGLAHAQALGDLTQTQKIWGGSGGDQFGESLAAQGRRAALGGGSIGYYPWDPVLDFTSGSSSANSVHPPPLSVAVGRVAWAASSGVYIAAWLEGGYPVFPAADFISVSSVGAVAMDGSRIALGIPGEDRSKSGCRMAMATGGSNESSREPFRVVASVLPWICPATFWRSACPDTPAASPAGWSSGNAS